MNARRGSHRCGECGYPFDRPGVCDFCGGSILNRDEADAKAATNLRLGVLEQELAEAQGWPSLVRDAAEFANRTFTTATHASKAEHLRREAIELAERPTDSEEMADVLLLLIHLADGQGVDLVDVARRKLTKNQARKWGKPDAQGVVEHVRDEVGP